MPNNNELLIQNLDSKITEQILSGILSLISPVINIKVFPDIQDVSSIS
jgi:hypothetical protein